MFRRTNDHFVFVVIENDELGPPPDHDGKSAVQGDSDGGAKALRPRSDRAERRFRPVQFTDEPFHLAAARKSLWPADFISTSSFPKVVGHNLYLNREQALLFRPSVTNGFPGTHLSSPPA